MPHQINQSTTSCFDCIYRYHYTITACSHTICIDCLHAAVAEKIRLQSETFICPRCPDKEEPTQVNQPQQQEHIQTLELQLKRLTEENSYLNQQLTQQQQQQTSSNSINIGASTNVKIQVLSEQIIKLSIDNANLEKQTHSNELLAKESQKEKEDLIRYNEQLVQSLQNAEKALKSIEEKHHKQLNESQTSYLTVINEYKRRIEQLETTDIGTITINNDEREQFEKEIYQLKQTIELNQQKEHEYNDLQQQLTKEIEEYKKKIDNLQVNFLAFYSF